MTDALLSVEELVKEFPGHAVVRRLGRAPAGASGAGR